MKIVIRSPIRSSGSIESNRGFTIGLCVLHTCAKMRSITIQLLGADGGKILIPAGIQRQISATSSHDRQKSAQPRPGLRPCNPLTASFVIGRGLERAAKQLTSVF